MVMIRQMRRESNPCKLHAVGQLQSTAGLFLFVSAAVGIIWCENGITDYFFSLLLFCTLKVYGLILIQCSQVILCVHWGRYWSLVSFLSAAWSLHRATKLKASSLHLICVEQVINLAPIRQVLSQLASIYGHAKVVHDVFQSIIFVHIQWCQTIENLLSEFLHI